jgi:sulfate transporter 4
LWKIDKFDFVVWVVSFVTTLFAGVEIGLLVSVGVSLLMVIYESAYPHTAVLGRLPGTTVYRNVKQYPEAETFDGIVLIRIDAPIYFANTQNIRDKLTKYEELAQAGKTQVKYIILELSPVSHIDSSALHILNDIIDTYKLRNIELCFSNPSVRVMERLLLGGLVEKVGRDHIFVTAHDAVNYCLHELDIAESQHGVKVLEEFDLEEQALREQ